ncbi:GGDEF domain-containing protein [Zavarzinia sp. CC-PAN008]|uniref:GGDEF domain-containing protein n=1 Tax=Zavarzinia sp. CC-PAN008 TaxID=3243332 RepID=UPI003F7484CA
MTSITADHPDRVQVQAALDRPSPLRLRFAPGLEARFEAETGADRCRQLRLWYIAGMASFQALLVPQYLLLPDVFTLALAVQLCVVTPAMLLLLLPLFGTPSVLVREGCIGAANVLGTASPIIMVLLSESPYRWAMSEALVVGVLYIALIQRLRFHVLVACYLADLALYLVALLSLPEGLSHATLARIQFQILVLFVTLYGAHVLERSTRRSYLLALLGRLQQGELERISKRDPLTGLGNRRALDEVLEAARDVGAAIALVLVDLDHFKRLNDAAGHPYGDQCLARVAGILRQVPRGEGDRAFRFGGEEFAIVLQDADVQAAHAVAERIRAAIQAAGIPHPGLAPAGVVTASIGVATHGAGAPLAPGALIAAADEALYAAKAAGRNTVRLALDA